MSKRKSVRTRGKLSLSKYFQKLGKGDRITVVREGSIKAGFPKQLQGRTGVVKGKRGHAYVVEIKDQNKLKEYTIKPIHLRKIKEVNK